MQITNAALQHGGQCVTTPLPELHDPKVLRTVDSYNALGLGQLHLHTDTTRTQLQCAPQLFCAHAVAQTKDASLTHEPLDLIGLGNLPSIDLGGKLGIHIPLLTERLHQIVLLCDVGH